MLLHDEYILHFFEFILQLSSQFIRFLFEVMVQGCYFHLVWLFLGGGLHHLIHLHETLSPQVDLVKYLALWADIVTLMGAEQSAV